MADDLMEFLMQASASMPAAPVGAVPGPVSEGSEQNSKKWELRKQDSEMSIASTPFRNAGSAESLGPSDPPTPAMDEKLRKDLDLVTADLAKQAKISGDENKERAEKKTTLPRKQASSQDS